MASKTPQRRPSALSGQSPARPSESTTAFGEQAASQTQPRPTGQGAGSKKIKVGIYMTHDDVDRAKRAWRATQNHTGLTSWTAFVEKSVAEFTRSLEAQHNDSTRF